MWTCFILKLHLLYVVLVCRILTVGTRSDWSGRNSELKVGPRAESDVSLFHFYPQNIPHIVC